MFREGLNETGVSLTCSQATINDPRTTTGAPSSPKLLGGLTGNTDATGSPKHPQSVAPQRGDLWKTLGAIYYFELEDKPNALRAFRQALLRERDPGEKGKLEAMVRELEG